MVSFSLAACLIFIFLFSFVRPDARQLPDVALTGKCTRDCDEFGHSDTCWMPIRPSPRQRQRHGSDPPRLSTFAPGDDNNNLRRNDHESDSESAGSAGSSEPGVVSSERLPLANGDPLGTLSRGDRNRNVGDHNRNLLNRKMTSASYDTFSSAGLGRRQQEEEGGESQNPPEVIPLTRTGGDYKTASCLTLSRREVYLWQLSNSAIITTHHTFLKQKEDNKTDWDLTWQVMNLDFLFKLVTKYQVRTAVNQIGPFGFRHIFKGT